MTYIQMLTTYFGTAPVENFTHFKKALAMRKTIKYLCIPLFLLYGVGANAGFIGHVMEVSTYIPPSPFFGSGGTFYNTEFEVSDALEVPLYGTFNEKIIDVSDSNITIDYWRSGRVYSTSSILIFRDINLTIDKIIDVSLNASTDGFITSWGGSTIFNNSRITFDENNIYIDLSSIGATQGTHLSLDVKFATVNEPSAILLLCCGLMFLVFSSRKSGKKRLS